MQELDRVRIIATGMTGTIVDIFGKEEKEYLIGHILKKPLTRER